ncbi:ABC transporter permease [Algoriphagus sp. NG3]|uniref:ABC transporter permease n=1 Tax=Algoriphagus sp. NG3 TaxID=3097546 RepID=UPI002A813BF2|nr:ABC transporter permease [Algoriphagus sp. NG3]WPR76062.1 ABC transporter permease [Algoriphagus sp. NG3]
MFRNFIKVSIRNLLKDKVHAGINLTGLMVGIFCSLVIILYANYELGFDRFHEKKDRIYRIATSYDANSGLAVKTSLSPSGLSPNLTQEITAIENSVRLLRYKGTITIQAENKKAIYEEKNIFRTEAQYFNIFNTSVIEGDITAALTVPNSIVLTESLANKYFSNQNPLHQTLFVDGQEYTVNAIIKDMPKNSDLYAEGFIWYDFSDYETWNDFDVYTYMLLRDNYPANESVISSVEKLVNDNCTALKAYNMKSSIAVDLQPLVDVHFINGLADDTPKGNRSYIYMLLAIGVLIITLVVINYINLFIVKSTERTTEVGIRKALGAQKIELIIQFVCEALLLTLIAFILSIILLLVFLPYINNYFGIQLLIRDLFEKRIILAILTTLVVVGFVSAIYPAFFLSSMNISRGLKGKGNLPSTQRVRKVLLVMQFSISTIAIICTFIIKGQMAFIWNHNLGFEKEQVMVVNVPEFTIYDKELYLLRDELVASSMESSVVGSTSYPGGESTPWQLVWSIDNNEKTEIAIDTYYTDENFGQLLNIPLVSGRNFQPDDNESDLQNTILVNESYVKFMGWKNNDDALGQRITVFDNYWDIIGVVKDFHYQSLSMTIKPLFIAMANEEWPLEKRLLVKVKHANDIKKVQEKWKTVTAAPFSFSFLDEDFQKYYKNEETLTRISSYFTLMSLLLAGVGLFGLSSLLATQRNKEIGIRKILGGSDIGIVLLLLKDFLALSCIGYIISISISWYIMSSWISQFPYQSTISLYWFLIPAFIIFLVTILSTSSHIIKGAMIKPVDSLKHE